MKDDSAACAKRTGRRMKADDKTEKRLSTFTLDPSHFQLLLLLVWVIIGTGLRFTHLDAKSPWTDEFSTMVFSLGNSFRTVPLDKAIALDVLLQPLQPAHPEVLASLQSVVYHLLNESNHPPVYFLLANLWMHLFPPVGDYVSLWVVRAFPALLGVASIPALYGLGRLAFRSRLVGQMAAAMMAVSPYGIYLAQEARHYTLAILLVIASLGCLVVAVRHIHRQTIIPAWVALIWVAVNSLGIAVHYFLTLTLCAEGIALVALLGHHSRKESRKARQRQSKEVEAQKTVREKIISALHPPPSLKMLLAVAAGTLIGGLVWLPVWQSSSDSQLTEWIYSSDRVGFAWISPLFQAFAAWVTMLSLLPVESSALPVVVVSGLVMLLFLIWVSPILWRGIKAQLATPANQAVTGVLAGFVLSAILIFFAITYGLGIDLTRGARYNFVYFPGAILLIGASLAVCWETFTHGKEEEGKKGQRLKFPMPHSPFKILAGAKTAVVLILLMGFVSGLTVVGNLGYQKYYRPDLLASIIQQASQSFQTNQKAEFLSSNKQINNSKSKLPNSQSVVLIATTHKTHVETGELMGLAWEFKRLTGTTLLPDLQFLLAHQDTAACKDTTCHASQTLQKTLANFSSADLWLVNFKVPANLNKQNCSLDTRTWPPVDGYSYQLYHCKF